MVFLILVSIATDEAPAVLGKQTFKRLFSNSTIHIDSHLEKKYFKYYENIL